MVETLVHLRTFARAAFIAVSQLCGACSSFSDCVVLIHATEFVNYRCDPLSHTVYTPG